MHLKALVKTYRTTAPIIYVLGLVLLAATPLSLNAEQLPALPQAFIDTTYSPPSGATITVNAGGNLQAALNDAQLGDTIVLQAGAQFTGPFTLPNKTSGSGWIYIVSSNYSSLPAPNNRVSPADAPNMPKIVGTSSGVNALKTASGAHHYRFVGIEFKSAANNFLYNLVQLGNGETSAGNLPRNITFDRCYIHGDPNKGGRRGVAMDGIEIAVVDSHVADFKDTSDAQALWAYNSPGPIKIVNNRLEATGENVMFGGSDPAINNLVPSDIEIRRNHFYKPLTWKGVWSNIKNLLEFKNAQRVLVEGNVFENNWASGQNGLSLLITPRNQYGSAPWSVTRDITIQYNQWLNVGGGINILGSDDEQSSQNTERVLIKNNLFVGVTGSLGIGRILQLLGDAGYPANITVEHNTGFVDTMIAMSANARMNALDFKNNIFQRGSYGFFGDAVGEGTAALDNFFTNWVFTNNAIIGGSSRAYPTSNYFPENVETVGFVNYSSGNYRLADASPYKGVGTDGQDIGADVDALEAASNASNSGGGGSATLEAPNNLRVVQ